jgi:hypothetical protein
MSLHDQLANDYLFFDNVENVTLDPADVGEPDIEDVPALRRELSFDEIHSMSYQMGDVAWHVWSSALGGYTPVAGDQVIDSGGTTWNVLSVAPATLETRYRLVCRQA